MAILQRYLKDAPAAPVINLIDDLINQVISIFVKTVFCLSIPSQAYDLSDIYFFLLLNTVVSKSLPN